MRLFFNVNVFIMVSKEELLLLINDLESDCIGKTILEVRHAQEVLSLNGNPPAVFDLGLVTKFMVTIWESKAW